MNRKDVNSIRCNSFNQHEKTFVIVRVRNDIGHLIQGVHERGGKLRQQVKFNTDIIIIIIKRVS